MANTEASAIRPLAAADFDGALALVAESGWNQVRADWQLFTELGAAFKVTDADGTVIATAATLPFQGFGWISMVLVATARRRQGLATALLHHCIAQLRGQGLVPVLDATAAGRGVYQPLGFRDGWAITRWRCTEGASSAPALEVDTTLRPLDVQDWPQVDLLDGHAFGADRRGLLRRLHARSAGFACVAEREDRIVGFLLGRDGRQATQVGPVVACEPDIGSALIAHALACIAGPVLVDALSHQESLARLLQAAGFTVERGYTRMALDAERRFGDARCMVAIAGPELG